MRVVITTMVWKRPDIFELWAKGIKRLQENFPEVELIASVCGSEGERSRAMVESHGFDYIEHPNQPIGKKANARLRRTKEFEPDYVILVGSDDLLSNDWFAYNLERMKEGYDEIAPMDIFYFDTHTLTSHYSVGYINHRRGEPIAVGRCVSRKLLERVDYTLWPDGIKIGLDSRSRERINNAKESHHYYHCNEEGLVVCDVKGDDSVHLFKARKNQIEITNEALFTEIPELRKYESKEAL